MNDPVDHAFFRQLELMRTRALVERDMVTIDALHAPEYELITPSGKAFDRALYFAAIESGPFYTAWDVGEMAWRISPSMATVRYKARLAFPSGREVTCWHTDTYEKRDGHWQAVWSQATQLPETPTPA
jgi:hypothetical protein